MVSDGDGSVQCVSVMLSLARKTLSNFQGFVELIPSLRLEDIETV